MNRPTDDPKHHLLQLRVSADYLKAVDAWRRLQPDPMPSRSEAVRQLTMIGLNSKAPKPKPRI